MANIQSLRSYLVSLGFSVNTAQLAQFNNAIQSAAQVIESNTKNISANILKWQGAVVGMFEAIGVSALVSAESVAMADQQYRLFGQRMFMSMENAKSLKISLDALGLSLEQIAFDQESHRRFEALELLQSRLGPMLGGASFEVTMRQIRDMQFEITKLRVESLYFIQLTTKSLFNALGGVNFTEKLRQLNEYIIQHIPEWSRIVTTYLVPVLKDAWLIFTDLLQVGKDFAQLFTNIVGLFSGDPTLQGQVSFEKFAHALEKVAGWLATIIHFLFQIEGILVGSTVGAAIGTLIGGAAGLVTGGPAGAIAGGATGGLIGAGVGAAGGGVFDLMRHSWHDSPIGNLDQVAQAVMQVESGGHQTDRFGRTLRSSAGALGLMQLMPGTAAGLGVDPNNAAQNLAGGRAYLNQLYGRFGNWHDALAAYNWGPGNVQNALRQHRAFPSSVEGYVNSVSGKMNVQIGSINIMQPNASPEQIKKAITDGIKEHQDKTAASNLAELRALYG